MPVNPLAQPLGTAELGQTPAFTNSCTCWEWAAVPSQHGHPYSSPSTGSNVKPTHFAPILKHGFPWPSWRMPGGSSSCMRLSPAAPDWETPAVARWVEEMMQRSAACQWGA